MFRLIALHSGKETMRTSSAIMFGTDCPCLVASGDYGYQPGFNASEPKRNGWYSAFFAECEGLVDMLKT